VGSFKLQLQQGICSCNSQFVEHAMQVKENLVFDVTEKAEMHFTVEHKWQGSTSTTQRNKRV